MSKDRNGNKDPRRVRIAVFKYYYATDHQYELYNKGDAGEFTDSLLELIHCAYPNNVLKACRLNIVENRYCLCAP